VKRDSWPLPIAGLRRRQRGSAATPGPARVTYSCAIRNLGPFDPRGTRRGVAAYRGHSARERASFGGAPSGCEVNDPVVQGRRAKTTRLPCQVDRREGRRAGGQATAAGEDPHLEHRTRRPAQRVPRAVQKAALAGGGLRRPQVQRWVARTMAVADAGEPRSRPTCGHGEKPRVFRDARFLTGSGGPLLHRITSGPPQRKMERAPLRFAGPRVRRESQAHIRAGQELPGTFTHRLSRAAPRPLTGDNSIRINWAAIHPNDPRGLTSKSTASQHR
jgi:hypothetical protein